MPVRTRSLTPMEKWPRGLWRSFAKGEGQPRPGSNPGFSANFCPAESEPLDTNVWVGSSRLSSPDISSRPARARPAQFVCLYPAGFSKYGINLLELNDICLFNKRLGEISGLGRPSHSFLGIVALHRALTPVREVRFFQGGPVFAGIAQSAERNVANVEVADSASAARTTIRRPGQALGMLSRIDSRCAPGLLVAPGALHLEERERSGPCDEYETGDRFGDGHRP